MKFDRPGIIGYHMDGLKTASFTRITKINRSLIGNYMVSFKNVNGRDDFWCITSERDDDNDFIEIDDIRYDGDELKEFCETFIAMTETEKAIDSL